ncbi:MAG: hypothetical protein DME98_09645 [Verrucomicrobia bacterium]|nr:MAG: hypothetical protein DME98_09645 [Verrucomicrobiota bacterium]PYJ35790.1 MAG: hypothetical protein DME88_00940 [Verrucomicrobiota bacterium]PYL95271.1 MAG: hypothetical protein DME28_02630 [Verrucomicrobiota bacterium]
MQNLRYAFPRSGQTAALYRDRHFDVCAWDWREYGGVQRSQCVLRSPLSPAWCPLAAPAWSTQFKQ